MPTEAQRKEAKHLALLEYCASHKDYRKSAILAGNVIGIGIGNRIKGGQPLTEECVRFYVDRKINHREAVDQAVLIKDKFGALRTDVIETRRFVSFQAGPGPGSSFGLAYRAPNVDSSIEGTLSAFVNIEGDYYALGSNHVMAVNGRVPVGTQVLFRPRGQFIDDPSQYIFARTTVHVPLSHSGVNHVDCALAKVEDEDRDKIEFDFPERIVSSTTLIDPQRDMHVARVDETERARGKIVDVNLRMRIDFRFGTYEFDDLIMIKGDVGPFAKNGDSGAIVVDQNTRQATAMIVGGTRNYTLACPLSRATTELGKALALQRAIAIAKQRGEPILAPEDPPEVKLLVARNAAPVVVSAQKDREYHDPKVAGVN